MVNELSVKRYCKDFKNIENYDLAINDTTQVWHCHHRLETETSDGIIRPKNAQLKHKELISLGMYWNRPANELIFLTKEEHEKLHRLFDCNEYYGSAKKDKNDYGRTYRKSYYEKHKEEVKAYDKVYTETNKEEKYRKNKIRNFIRRKGIITDLSKLPKKWNNKDIEYYKVKFLK